MATYKIAVKRPNEALAIIDFEGTYRSDVAPLIGNPDNTYLQYVFLGNEGDRCLAMVCDEDGMAKNLPANFQMLTQNGNHCFFETIPGTVVFLVYQDENTWEKEIWDFELRSLNDKDIAKIKSILSKESQKTERFIAELDPRIVKEPTMFFEPIEDLEDYLGLTPSPYVQINSLFILSYLFKRWLHSKPITFYADRKGTMKYTTGFQRSPFSTTLELFCKSEDLAHSYKKEIPLLPNGVSFNQAMTHINELLHIFSNWGIPSFVYVTKETKEILMLG